MPPVQRDAARQTKQARFRHIVGKEIVGCHRGVHAGDIDDDARLPRRHQGQGMFAAKPRPPQIQRQRPLPCFDAHGRGVEVLVLSRVVDQNIQPAIRVRMRLDAGYDLLFLADVDLYELRLMPSLPQGVGRRNTRLHVDLGDSDRRAFPRQRFGDAKTYALTRARHKSALALQPPAPIAASDSIVHAHDDNAPRQLCQQTRPTTPPTQKNSPTQPASNTNCRGVSPKRPVCEKA